MKAFKGIGSQLVLSFAVAVCVAIILVSLGLSGYLRHR